MKSYKSLNVSPETYELVVAHGTYKDSVDAIIKRVFTEYDILTKRNKLGQFIGKRSNRK